MKDSIIGHAGVLISAMLICSTAEGRNLTWDASGVSTPTPVEGSGDWSTVNTNWIDQTTQSNTSFVNGFPDSAQFGATVSDAVVTPFTVALTTNITVQNLTIQRTYNVFDQGSGEETLTLAGNVTKSGRTSQIALVNALKLGSGSHVFTVNGAADGSHDLTVDSSLTGATASITKAGVGILRFGALNDYGGGTTVTGGTLIVADAGALGTGGLSITAGATTRIKASLPKAVTVANITTAGTGKLDLTNNAMVVKNSTLAAVKVLVTAGYHNGDWLGGGLTSSTAANDPNGLTALGFVSNADLGATTFKGVTGLDSDDVLVKYTYYGDSDLNGVVDPDDFNSFLAGFQDKTLPRTWVYGDFDYNGVIDPDDFNLFLATFQFHGAPLSALIDSIESSTLSAADQATFLNAVAAVPEPTIVTGIGAVMLTLATTRRRR